MKKTRNSKVAYALYNLKDECVCVGSALTCAKYMGTSLGTFHSLVYKYKKGIVKNPKSYAIYKIEEGENG